MCSRHTTNNCDDDDEEKEEEEDELRVSLLSYSCARETISDQCIALCMYMLYKNDCGVWSCACTVQT